jgi:hypothetical protein
MSPIRDWSNVTCSLRTARSRFVEVAEDLPEALVHPVKAPSFHMPVEGHDALVNRPNRSTVFTKCRTPLL